MSYYVNPDITKAETLPSSFYRSSEVFESMKDKVFLKAWQWLGNSQDLLPLDGYAQPFNFMENYLQEPMVLLRDKASKIKCLSNVCTHRGNIVAHNPGLVSQLSCMYHGRRWDLDGQFKFMPEFKEAKDFPRPCDHLHRFPLKKWNGHLFTSLEPEVDFSVISNFLDEYVGFLPLKEFKLDPTTSKDYLVNCHWSLYCDNFLEGFHIPFVHSDLNAVLDYDTYTTVLSDYGTLQIGYADGGEEVFDLPEGHPCYGKDVSAFYFWIFPNMMLNFYPWGLSVNIVKPISPTRTKVSFISYVHGDKEFDAATSAAIDKVEREDEFVVEGVHKGLQSRYYSTGRFSPTREQGVHHFHRMLAERM